MRFVRRILKDEEGASVIMIAVAIVMVFGFAVVAIDMSLIQLAKTQLQNAADAGALAGALMLATTSGSQEDKEAAATAEAIRVCSLNVALQEIDRSVVITPDKVTFPQPTLVRVTTGTGDYVTTYFLKVLDPLLTNQEEITATAMAGVEKICGTDCLKPFCPPDRWDDVDSNGIWTPDDEYDDVNASGGWEPGEPLTMDWNENGVWDPAEFYDPELTGYKAPDDIGDTVTFRLQAATASLGMFWYYTVCFGPINTGDPVSTGTVSVVRWISGECEPFIVSLGDLLQVEPGNFANPTSNALDELWDLDPDAYWDDATGTVMGSLYGDNSPRIIKAPAFDPTLGLQTDLNGRKYLTISNILVLFLDERHQFVSGELLLNGRFITTITEGVTDPDCPGGFMSAVVLVE